MKVLISTLNSTGGAGAVGTFGMLHVTKTLVSINHTVVDAPCTC